MPKRPGIELTGPSTVQVEERFPALFSRLNAEAGDDGFGVLLDLELLQASASDYLFVSIFEVSFDRIGRC